MVVQCLITIRLQAFVRTLKVPYFMCISYNALGNSYFMIGLFIVPRYMLASNFFVVALNCCDSFAVFCLLILKFLFFSFPLRFERNNPHCLYEQGYDPTDSTFRVLTTFLLSVAFDFCCTVYKIRAEPSTIGFAWVSCVLLK